MISKIIKSEPKKTEGKSFGLFGFESGYDLACMLTAGLRRKKPHTGTGCLVYEISCPRSHSRIFFSLRDTCTWVMPRR
jgi:hypothetical protein